MAYKILSLDGGGPWALIEALALGDLFPNASGHEILGHFDLAIANSGGSIVLAGLIKDLSPSQIADLFLNANNRNQIFQRTSLVEYFIDKSIGIGPKWSTEGKLAGLTALMNAAPGPAVAGMKMSGLPNFVKATTGRDLQIIITAFEYDFTREVFFASGPSTFSTLGTFEPMLVDAVHASSNAPVNYFDAPAVVTSVKDPADVHRFWDGGVGGFNNPVLHGVAQALSLGHAASEVIALSLGTATVWQPLGIPTSGESKELFQPLNDPSTVGDLSKLAASVLDDPPDAASINAHFVTGAAVPSRIVRLSPFIAPFKQGGAWILPPGFSSFVDTSNPPNPIHELDAFTTLRDMPMDAVDPDDVDVIRQLALLWIGSQINNQPILHDPIEGSCLTGYPLYSAGKQAVIDFGF